MQVNGFLSAGVAQNLTLTLSAPGSVRDINSHLVICLPLMVVRLSGVRMLGILGFMLYHLSHLHVL